MRRTSGARKSVLRLAIRAQNERVPVLAGSEGAIFLKRIDMVETNR